MKLLNVLLEITEKALDYSPAKAAKSIPEEHPAGAMVVHFLDDAESELTKRRLLRDFINSPPTGSLPQDIRSATGVLD